MKKLLQRPLQPLKLRTKRGKRDELAVDSRREKKAVMLRSLY